MMSKKILVIRVSKMDGVDPIEEIKRTIEDKQHCWFGKYGRLIGREAFSEKVSKNIVILLRSGTTYTSHVFRRATVQRTIPTDGCYPPYYNEIIGRIRFWIKLRAAPDAAVNVSDLQIVSSKMPLLDMLGKAMTGHFICELRAGLSDNTFL